MDIIALYLCIQATGKCAFQGPDRIVYAGTVPVLSYSSLEECLQAGQLVSGRYPDENGRFPIANGALFYECHVRHLDTRTPAR
jgi:hypothetical protein